MRTQQLTCSMLFLSLSSLALTGCVHANHAQVQWTKNLRQLGISPVYPPREDLFVGDIYVTSYDPDSKATARQFEHGDLRIGMEPRFGHIDPSSTPTGADHAALEERPMFPQTPDAATGNMTATDMRIWREPEASSPEGFFGGQPTKRLRVVEMPDFASVVLTKADADASFPVEGVTAAISGTFSKFNSVTLKVPAAESYSVDTAPLLKSFGEMVGRTCASKCIYGLSALASGKYVWVKLVSEVYYARAIDITALDRLAAGGRGSGNVGAGSASSTTTDVNCPSASDPAPASAINTAAHNTPGGTLVVTHCSTSSLSMRRVFPQPIAIGTRGIVLKVDAKTNEIVSVLPSGGLTPTLTP